MASGGRRCFPIQATKGYLYAAIAIFCWATLTPVTKLLLADLTELQALGFSALFGGLFMLLVSLLCGGGRRFRGTAPRGYGKILLLGALGMFFYSVFYFNGVNEISARDACIINYLWPILVILFSRPILGEPLTRRKLLAVGASFVGVIILSLGNAGEAGGNILLGAAFCLAGAVCYGIYTPLNKKFGLDPLVVMPVAWLFAGVLALGWGLLSEEWIMPRGMHWLGLLWIGILPNGIAYLAWALAINRSENTAKIANLAYLVPILSMFLSALLLGEAITWPAVVALVFILGGILYQSMEAQQEEEARQEEER